MTKDRIANDGLSAPSGDSVKESYCDILIIGAGPAGLMAANWLAVQGLGPSVRIIDKRNDKIFNGQADGLQCRSLEILHSFGLAEGIWRQSNRMIEMQFWNPGPDGQLQRTGRKPDTIPGISRWQQCVLHQGRIEKVFLDSIAEHSRNKLSVERAILPESLTVDEAAVDDSEAFPIQVEVRRLSEEEATASQMGQSIPNGLFRSSLAPDDTPSAANDARVESGTRERIHAKYVIGCDGAHSWTRRQMGSKMEGDQTSFVWGVLDAVPITNFPDVRSRCAIHSADSGSMMIIPREDGLVRFYIQVSELNKGIDRYSITPEMILKTAKAIIAPYTLDIGEGDLDWWTAYVIGQRTADKFSLYDRVFIAGDACHTHSPKAGQGMNTSMQDAYNLTWKIASVIKRVSPRSILPTYEMERKQIAQDLITFDHKFSRLFSGKPARDEADAAGISMTEFQQAFEKGNRFASGLSVDYQRSLITVKPEGSSHTSIEGGIVVSHAKVEAPADHVVSDAGLSGASAGEKRIEPGKRFNTAQVVCHATALPYELADWIVSDGRWRIVYFCGDIRNADCNGEMKQVGDYVAQQLVPHFTPKDQDPDSIIEVLTVSATPRGENELQDYHEALRPSTSRHHRPTADNTYNVSADYHKIFVDDDSYHQGHGQAYRKYGLRQDRGTLVVIRPDGYVSLLIAARQYDKLGKFFDKVLLPASKHLTHQHTRIKREQAKYMLVESEEEVKPKLPARAELPTSTLARAHSQKTTQGSAAPTAAM
ncbi:putative phenol 2-monooxygenase [Mycosarcoma maydis]|uniref:Phenol 2-monooxygenase n=1 Tax=Mycosarcoma maydis TaxID=5270 RepID=A0A0D1DSF0_MYCMD|nr:putative phenol 2-monooxygenase [Ustilago maydis 521]KIS67244.1 putative phenol 2-monooxygenase [Ustilago maydis 521]|eukprot:XP_011391058.1 putative phenol 2-monooxygenase [Ustilago maydis 521]